MTGSKLSGPLGRIEEAFVQVGLAEVALVNRLRGSKLLKTRWMQVFLAAGAGMFLYTAYSGFNSGVHPVAAILFAIILGLVSGVLAAAAWLAGRAAWRAIRVNFWTQVYFISHQDYGEEARSPRASRDAPAVCHFNKGSTLIAFKWKPGPWDEQAFLAEYPRLAGNKEVIKTAARAHVVTSARYMSLPPVDPELPVRLESAYIKRIVPLHEAVGEGWRWATREFFYEYSPLRIGQGNRVTDHANRSNGKRSVDPDMVGSRLEEIAEMKFTLPETMSPATYYARLESNSYTRAIRAVLKKANPRMQMVKNLQWGVVGILALSIILIFALQGGGDPNAGERTQTPIEATSTAVAGGSQ